jgi:hypothetical protein
VEFAEFERYILSSSYWAAVPYKAYMKPTA